MSGKGLHIFLQSELDVSLPTTGSPEIYDGSRARFIVVTGNCFEGHDELRTSDEAVLKAIEICQTKSDDRVIVEASHVVSSEREAVKFALDLLDQRRCDDRSEWFRVLSAVKSTLGQDGWDLADGWSKGSDSYEIVENIKTWDSIREDEILLGSLFLMVKEDTGIQIKIGKDSAGGTGLLHLLEASMFPIGDIPGNVDVDWLVEGLIAHGHHTLISGREKSGKSTLIGELLKALLDPKGGEFLDIPVEGGKKVLVITEESPVQWKRRRDKIELEGELYVCSHPFGKPSKQDWKEFCDELALKLKAENYDLLVIDPLAYFLPWKDENSSTEVTMSMTPLDAFKKLGIALLTCHHGNKSSGVARGSTAITSMTDINLDFAYPRKKVSSDDQDRFDTDTPNRILKCEGRFSEVSGSLSLGFNDLSETYELREGAPQKAKNENKHKLVKIINNASEPVTKLDLLEMMDDLISEPTLRRYLIQLVKDEVVKGTGEGNQSDPYKYEIIKDKNLDDLPI